MSRLEEAAIALHEVMWFNVGPDLDWPLRIEYDSDQIYSQFVHAFNELDEAVKEVRPGSSPWPIPSITL